MNELLRQPLFGCLVLDEDLKKLVEMQHSIPECGSREHVTRWNILEFERLPSESSHGSGNWVVS